MSHVNIGKQHSGAYQALMQLNKMCRSGGNRSTS